jgi:lysophospholipase L1-like esterase
MRILCLGCVLVGSVVVSGCEKLGGGSTTSPLAPTGPPAPGSAVIYSVVGASDVVGFGSTKVCLPFEDCNGNGYAWVAARQLTAQGFPTTVAPLGIPGAVISRALQDLALQYGRSDVPANLIQSEMPFVRKDATVVTVFVGGNDVNVITSALGLGAGGADPSAFIDQQVATFDAGYKELIAGIRARATGARIIVLNLPNMAGLPYLASASLVQKQAAQRASVRMTTTVINPTSNVTVIDLMCDARSYQRSNYASDGFHPNDALYTIMGTAIVQAITASLPAPPASCSQMSLF